MHTAWRQGDQGSILFAPAFHIQAVKTFKDFNADGSEKVLSPQVPMDLKR